MFDHVNAYCPPNDAPSAAARRPPAWILAELTRYHDQSNPE